MSEDKNYAGTISLREGKDYRKRRFRKLRAKLTRKKLGDIHEFKLKRKGRKKLKDILKGERHRNDSERNVYVESVSKYSSPIQDKEHNKELADLVGTYHKKGLRDSAIKKGINGGIGATAGLGAAGVSAGIHKSALLAGYKATGIWGEAANLGGFVVGNTAAFATIPLGIAGGAYCAYKTVKAVKDRNLAKDTKHVKFKAKKYKELDA